MEEKINLENGIQAASIIYRRREYRLKQWFNVILYSTIVVELTLYALFYFFIQTWVRAVVIANYLLMMIIFLYMYLKLVYLLHSLHKYEFERTRLQMFLFTAIVMAILFNSFYYWINVNIDMDDYLEKYGVEIDKFGLNIENEC